MLIQEDTLFLYENELGEKIELSFFTPFIPQEISENMSNTIYSSKIVGIQGNKYLGGSLEDRLITITGVTERTKNLECLRLKFLKILNPVLTGKLYYIKNGENRYINVALDKKPTFIIEGGLPRFTIDFVANIPFWQSPDKLENLAILTPSLRFPLTIPKKQGVAFGVKRNTLISDIYNDGDVSSGFKVLLKATSGVVENPTVYNAITGDYIKINTRLEKGEMLEVINFPEQKKITKNYTDNVFKQLDIKSTFFELIKGTNKIGYTADLNAVNLSVAVVYNSRYLEV